MVKSNCMENKFFISVIICTYNRCESLKDTLESLLNQEPMVTFNYEILVVDNNSTDKTKETIESCMPKFNKRLRYVFEQNRGLSYARNRGIKEANGEILAFTDDDVIVDKEWLLNIYKCFRNYSCDAMGGRVLPLYPNRTPKWIKDCQDLLSGPILIHDYGDGIKVYNRKVMLPFVGANMAIRKNCFNNNGLFRIDLGAGRGSLGEDTDFYKNIARNGSVIYYCGNVSVMHKVDRKRMNLFYIAKWYVAFGRYEMIQEINEIPQNLVCYFGIPRCLIKKVLKDIPFLFSKVFNRKEFLKAWMRIFWNVGKMSQYRISIST